MAHSFTEMQKSIIYIIHICDLVLVIFLRYYIKMHDKFFRVLLETRNLRVQIAVECTNVVSSI